LGPASGLPSSYYIRAGEQFIIVLNQRRLQVAIVSGLPLPKARDDDVVANQVLKLEIAAQNLNKRDANIDDNDAFTPTKRLAKRKLAIPQWALILVIVFACVVVLGLVFCLANTCSSQKVGA
jgi:hypothetical protein